MINTLLGIKKNMTSTYDSRGRRVGATVVEISPNMVTQIKSDQGKDGYNGVQLGIGSKKSLKKPQLGHLKKAGVTQSVRWLREFRIKGDSSTMLGTLQPGTSISLNQVFSVGDAVKVTGVSKGKGFQGGVRRHGFHGGPKTHGQSDRHRAPGSIGQTTTPGRVYKGKKMAGHMGVDQTTVRNLEVVGLDRTNNLLVLKGAVPGHTGTLLTISKLGRIKGYTPPPEEKEEEVEESDNQLSDLSSKSPESSESVVGQSVTDAPITDQLGSENREPKTDNSEVEGEQNAS